MMRGDITTGVVAFEDVVPRRFYQGAGCAPCRCVGCGLMRFGEWLHWRTVWVKLNFDRFLWSVPNNSLRVEQEVREACGGSWPSDLVGHWEYDRVPDDVKAMYEFGPDGRFRFNPWRGSGR